MEARRRWAASASILYNYIDALAVLLVHVGLAQGSFAQKVLLRLGKPESVLWHHLRYLWWTRLPVYATPVVVGGRLRGDAWCGIQLSTPPGSALMAHVRGIQI